MHYIELYPRERRCKRVGYVIRYLHSCSTI